MNRRLIDLLRLLTLSLAIAYAQPASATCEPRSAGLSDEDGSGTGGTGFGSGGNEDGSGVGGTGIYAQGGSGAGGTGLNTGDDDMSGSGTGGTGILGLITGFGSVCVNGLKIEYDAATSIERNGMPAGVSDLAVGQVVRIHTDPTRPLRAAHLTMESALAGPVDRIDVARGMLWVMGQPVELRPDGGVFDRRSGTASSLGEIKAGSHIDVSGLRRGDGVVVASRLDQRSENSPALITGTANLVSANTVYVGGLRSTTETHRTDSQPPGSDRVLLRGNWNPETKTLERAQIEMAPTHRSATRNLSVQGYVTRHRAGGVGVQGTKLELSDLADVGLLRTDTLVRVEGRLDSQGRLRARRVVVEERGRSGMLIDAHSDSRDKDKDRDKNKDKEKKDRSEREDREDREDRDGREHREERSGRAERSDRPDREPRPERSERRERTERERADRADR
jgi:hypothetical protein